MKRLLLLAILITGLGSLSLFAQLPNIDENPSYGPDSASRMECANNLSTMSEFMKIHLYNYALPSWQRVFDNCPASSKNIYIYGVRIYRDRIENARDETARASALDTLMLIYDKRIENFGQEGLTLGRKGLDLLKYDRTKVTECYEMLKKSVELAKVSSEPAVIVTLMQLSNALFQNGTIEGRELIDNYLVTTAHLERRIKAGAGADQAGKALENVETIFAGSGAADCPTLVGIFTPKFENNPEDLDFLKKLTTLLADQHCEDTELFAKSSENLYKLEPSAQAAYNLAKLFFRKEDMEKTVAYYEEAIAGQADAVIKAKYQYELGLIQFSKYDALAEARNLARQAISNNPNWGEPYILIGNLYASSSSRCGENDFEKTTIFWAAVDQFAKAKAVDPNVSQQANELISRYSTYFPNVEDAFFYGYADGQDFTVGCWINEKTRVRTRQKP